MTEAEIDERLKLALLAFGDSQARLPGGSERFNGKLTMWECEQVVKVVRQTLADIQCRICEEEPR